MYLAFYHMIVVSSFVQFADIHQDNDDIYILYHTIGATMGEKFCDLVGGKKSKDRPSVKKCILTATVDQRTIARLAHNLTTSPFKKSHDTFNKIYQMIPFMLQGDLLMEKALWYRYIYYLLCLSLVADNWQPWKDPKGGPAFYAYYGTSIADWFTLPQAKKVCEAIGGNLPRSIDHNYSTLAYGTFFDIIPSDNRASNCSDESLRHSYKWWNGSSVTFTASHHPMLTCCSKCCALTIVKSQISDDSCDLKAPAFCESLPSKVDFNLIKQIVSNFANSTREWVAYDILARQAEKMILDELRREEAEKKRERKKQELNHVIIASFLAMLVVLVLIIVLCYLVAHGENSEEGGALMDEPAKMTARETKSEEVNLSPKLAPKLTSKAIPVAHAHSKVPKEIPRRPAAHTSESKKH